MYDPFLGQIFYFAGNFQIRGTVYCAGQLMAISQNTALFSLLGTQYGGDGRTTFGLPDLRGRAGVGQGSLPGGDDYIIGEAQGIENTTMLITNMPAHNHNINANTGPGNSNSPVGGIFTEGPKTGSGPFATVEKIYNATAPTTNLLNSSIGVTGSNLPFSILQPYLALNFILATSGIFPTRN